MPALRWTLSWDVPSPIKARTRVGFAVGGVAEAVTAAVALAVGDGGRDVLVGVGRIGVLVAVGGTDVLVDGTEVLVGTGEVPAGWLTVVAWKDVMLAEALSTCIRRPHCPLLRALFVTVIVQALGSAVPAAQALA